MAAGGDVAGVNGLTRPTYSHLTNTGAITSTGVVGGWPIVAGLINQAGGTIEDSSNSGTVTHSHSVTGSVAGIANIPQGYLGLNRVASIGNVVCSGAKTDSAGNPGSNCGSVGGLIGQISSAGDSVSINNSYVNATVSGMNDGGYVAALIGNIYNLNTGDSVSIQNTYFASPITDTMYSARGIASIQFAGGQVPTFTFSNVYWASDAHAGKTFLDGSNMATYVTAGGVDFSSAGVGLTDADMLLQASFTGFSFGTIWNAPAGPSTYPTLL